MNKEQRAQITADLRKLCDEIEHIKTKDYAPDEDVLANFKEASQYTGMSKFQVWSVYAGKHFAAIINAVKRNPENPTCESEPIKTRIVDALVYLHILQCLIEENNPSGRRVGRPPGRRNNAERPAGTQESYHEIPARDPAEDAAIPPAGEPEINAAREMAEAGIA